MVQAERQRKQGCWKGDLMAIFLLLLMLLLLALGLVLAGAGAVVALAVMLVIGTLVAVAMALSSALMAMLNGKWSTGFKAFFLQALIVAGLLGGLVLGVAVTIFCNPLIGMGLVAAVGVTALILLGSGAVMVFAYACRRVFGLLTFRQRRPICSVPIVQESESALACRNVD
jgi:hypothetical protein